MKKKKGKSQGTQGSKIDHVEMGDFYGHHHGHNPISADNAQDITAIEERAVWRAVITQALMDAKSKCKKKEYAKWKAEALHWLFEDVEDFETVCAYADLCPVMVRELAKIAQTRDFTWRNGKPKLSKKL